MEHLWQWTASDLAAAIQSGKISSVEATKSVISRMNEVNPQLNAIVDDLSITALKDAEDADKILRERGPLGPLHGVPVTTKVNVDYAGHATTNGVVANKDLIAAEDGSVVRNFKAAGAVVFGRTNTPCYSIRLFTSNDLHGATRNPHNPEITPGGSSGGAASAIAAGIGPVAHGNDLGGSIRYPAYACGVYGLRPSTGLVPAYNPSQPAERMIVSLISSVQGPLARSIEDLRLAMQALIQPDPRDVLQVPLKGLFDPLDREPCKVAMMAETDECTVDPEVSAAIRQAGAILASAGYEVVETKIPSLLEASRFWRKVLINEMCSGMADMIEELGDAKARTAMKRLQYGLEELPSRDAFLKEFAKRSTFLREWQLFFQQFPIVLTASSWVKPMIDDYDVKDGVDYDHYARITAPMSATPTLGLPGLAVPVGTRPGHPMGVQLLANRFEDRRLLIAGKAIEQEIGLLRPIDPINN